MNRVLVTGASGYIGAQLTAVLAQTSSEVIASGLPGTESAIPRHPRVRAIGLDIDQRQSLTQLANGVDVVFHLAGALPGASEPVLRSVNVDGAAHLARAAVDNGVPRIVFLSSTAVYRQSPHVWPLPEDAPLVVPGRITPGGYGPSKVAAEEVLASIASDSTTALTIIRASTVYGRSSRTIAWLRRQLLIPAGLAAPTAHIPTMQWVFADDLVAALVKASNVPEVANRIVNVVGGDLVSYSTLLAVARTAQRSRAAAPPPPRLQLLRFSYDTANAYLRYEPRPLLHGLRTALA